MSTSGPEQASPRKYPVYSVVLTLLLGMFLTLPLSLPIHAQGGDETSVGRVALPTPPGTELQFGHLSMEHGLSNNIVWSVLQDSRGLMWFATIDGLNRYDGYEAKVYRHDPEDPNSLSTNPLRVVYEDQAGNLWVGTSGGGLNRFDREAEQFIHFQHDPNDPHTLSGNDVRSIYEDQTGALWIGTTAGLNRLNLSEVKASGPGAEDEQTVRFTRFKHDPDDPQSLSRDFVQSVIQDRDGMIWIGTWGGGLDRFDPQTEQFTHYRHDPDNPSSLSNNFVSVVVEDETGTLWVGTNGGLNKLDREGEAKGQTRFFRFQHDPNDPSSLSDDTIRSVYEDRAGNLWVGSFGGGLNWLDRAAGTFIRYQHNPADSHSLGDNDVISIQEDRVGSLWVGTIGGGINVVDANRKLFAHFQHRPSDPHSLGDKSVRSIYEDRSGVLWIGTEEGGLDRFDRDTGMFTHYRHDLNNPHSLSDNFVWSIAEDPAGVLWIGTEAGGLNRLDLQSASPPGVGHFEHYWHDPADPSSVGSNSIRSVLIDQSGDIWLGTRGNGLDRFDPETETFTHYLHDPNDPDSLSDNAVRVLYQDSGSNLWIGTIGGGLDRFDPATQTFVHYQNDPSDPSSLSDNSVRAILEDRAGNLWIGTWGGGLNKLDRTHGTFAHYTEKEGLANNVIWGMLEDNVPPEEGGPSLWISTNQGLSRFNLEAETFRNYDSADGLQSNAFYSAQYKDINGVLYFGGTNGFNAFDPRELRDNPHLPPVVLVDFQLGNRPVPIGGDSVLQKSIVETDELVLSHKDRVITFEFAALNYSSSEKNRYRYTLEGFDDGWAEVDGDHRLATYTNLDPGEYMFRVIGSNNDGVWNEEGTALRLTITPPWWGTWWFRGVALLLVVGLAAGGYSLRVRSIQARSRELEAEVAAKTKKLQEEINEREETERRLRTTRDELAAVLAISKEIVSTLDLDPLLQLILDKAGEVIDNNGAGILTLKDMAFDFRVYQGLSLAADLESTRMPVAGITPFRELVNTKQAVIVHDVHQEPGLAQEFRESIGHSMVELFGGAHSWMCVPMIASDEVVGMLGFIHQEPGYYQPEVSILAQVFADQAAIAIENAQLYEKAQEMAVLEERNRLARELHDSVTQTLYSTNLFADAAHLALSADSTHEAGENLNAARDLIWQAMLEMRMLLFELRPPLLEEQGLVGALQTRLETVEGQVELPIEFRVEGERQLPPSVETELYYVALEALNNIAKHAQAKQVAVHLKVDEERCLLTIQDDGVGFDPEAAGLGGGQGLRNMQERIDQIGGRLKLDTAPGSGTTIQVEVNL